MPSRVALSVGQIVVLSLWLGAAVFMSAAVAPALFAVLPSRTMAGNVVGRLLPGIFYAGILIALVVIPLGVKAHGAWRWRGAETAAAVMLAGCAIAQLLIGPRIERVRESIGGPVDALPIDDARRVAFGQLHAVSVGWLGLAMLAAAAAVILLSRDRTSL